MGSVIIADRLLASLARFFPATCTIQQAAETRDNFGQPRATWQAVAGLVDLPCVVAPLSPTTPTATEVRTAVLTYSRRGHVILLRGHYPAIAPTMRAVVAGQVYDILGVEHDSHAIVTRLKVEEVR